MTLELWFKRKEPSSTKNMFSVGTTAADVVGLNADCSVLWTGNGSAVDMGPKIQVFRFEHADHSWMDVSVGLDDTSDPADLPWHHLVGRFRAVDQYTDLYVDGVLVDSTTNGDVSYSGITSQGLRLGAAQGRYCRAAVYHSMLSPTRIVAHYDLGIINA
jgi:hypothetical protein